MEFPHLVQMHQRYAKDGVACLSVTVDEMDQREAALKFLKAKGAAFPNYLLDEDIAVWQAKWAIMGPPAVFVFDRTGKQAGKFDSDSSKDSPYTEVEKLVKKLLAETK